MTLKDLSWQPLPTCGDALLRRWLIDRGSLTRRIQLRCAAFRLDVLSQEMARARPDEAPVIGLKAGVRCLEREVTLNCGSRAVVFAHSVAPLPTLKGAWHMLGGLGTRPLGAALFADPCVRRHPLRYRQLSARHALYHRAARFAGALPATLWARRSLFVLDRAPLLVTEVFLPAILALAP